MADERPRVMGAHEIRERLGVLSRQRVYQLTRRDDFPKPVADLAQGKIWLYEDVEAWVIRHRVDPHRRHCCHDDVCRSTASPTSSPSPRRRTRSTPT